MGKLSDRKITLTIGVAVGLCIGLCTGLFAGNASAGLFDTVLKTGGAVVIADKFGSQIDKGINQLTGQKHLDEADAKTKVVPVLSIGSGGYVGVVQVSGPPEAVDQTKAVAQIEIRIPIIGGIRTRALIPINARSTSNIKRVNGVGVSALVDVKI
jgi:hypothetical protein